MIPARMLPVLSLLDIHKEGAQGEWVLFNDEKVVKADAESVEDLKRLVYACSSPCYVLYISTSLLLTSFCLSLLCCSQPFNAVYTMKWIHMHDLICNPGVLVFHSTLLIYNEQYTGNCFSKNGELIYATQSDI